MVRINATAAGLAGLCLVFLVAGTGLVDRSEASPGVFGREGQAARDGAEGTFAGMGNLWNAAGSLWSTAANLYPLSDGALSRIGGSDRYQTAALLAGARFGSAETVILVGGDCYYDGAAACGLAGALTAPLLLTAKDYLPDATGECLGCLKANRVIIVGGKEAVAFPVEEALRQRGLSVERLGGRNRAETAALVAERIREEPVPGYMNRDGGSAGPAFIAGSMTEADCLAAGSAAFKYGVPILLVERDVIPEATVKAISRLGIDELYIIGGEEAVGAPVERELARLVKTNRRLAGADRYETCAAVARYIFGPFPSGGVVLTGGDRRQLADALGAAGLGRPVLFAGKPLSLAVISYLQAAARGGAAVTLVGGERAISPGLELAVRRLVEEAREAREVRGAGSGKAGDKGKAGQDPPAAGKKVQLTGLPETVDLWAEDIIELPVTVCPPEAEIEAKSGDLRVVETAVAEGLLMLKGVAAGEAEVRVSAALAGYRRGEAVLKVKVFESKWCSLDPEGLRGVKAEELSFVICDGLPYIAFRDAGRGRNQKASAMVFQNGKWEYAGKPGFTPGMAYEPTLAAAPGSGAGPLYLAYRASNCSRLEVMRFTDGGWKAAGEPHVGSGIVNISLAVWKGYPCIAFSDGAFMGRVTVMGCPGGGSWEIVGSRGFSSGTVSSVCLAAGGKGAEEGSGRLAVAFQDGGYSWGATVMEFNGKWAPVGSPGISAGKAYSIQICWEEDVLYVAFQDQAEGGKATVKRFTGGRWETVGRAGFTGGAAGRISLQVSDGMPYIAFKDGSCQDKVTVMRFAGNDWETVGVPGFSAWEAEDVCLQFYRGEPAVACREKATAGKVAVFKYGREW